jgi:hypothetical protein
VAILCAVLSLPQLSSEQLIWLTGTLLFTVMAHHIIRELVPRMQDWLKLIPEQQRLVLLIVVMVFLALLAVIGHACNH